jgi:hypothetical protein
MFSLYQVILSHAESGSRDKAERVFAESAGSIGGFEELK